MRPPFPELASSTGEAYNKCGFSRCNEPALTSHSPLSDSEFNIGYWVVFVCQKGNRHFKGFQLIINIWTSSLLLHLPFNIQGTAKLLSRPSSLPSSNSSSNTAPSTQLKDLSSNTPRGASSTTSTAHHHDGQHHTPRPLTRRLRQPCLSREAGQASRHRHRHPHVAGELRDMEMALITGRNA